MRTIASFAMLLLLTLASTSATTLQPAAVQQTVTEQPPQPATAPPTITPITITPGQQLIRAGKLELWRSIKRS